MLCYTTDPPLERLRDARRAPLLVEGQESFCLDDYHKFQVDCLCASPAFLAEEPVDAVEGRKMWMRRVVRGLGSAAVAMTRHGLG